MMGMQQIRVAWSPVTTTVRDCSLRKLLEYAGVALLFAACGLWTNLVFNSRGSGLFDACAGMVLATMPFAGVCALLFARTWRIVPAAMLLGADLLGAIAIALSLIFHLGRAEYGVSVGMLTAGLVGGAGVVVSLSVCNRLLFSYKRIVCGAAVGCLASIPFILSLSLGAAMMFPFGFAVWQAALGGYLYAFYSRPTDARLPVVLHLSTP